jgi:hypothetical protein
VSPRGSLLLLSSVILAGSALFSAGGCGPSAEDRLARALEKAGVKPVAVFPFAGKVTVDGLPPNGPGAVLVMLSDPHQPDTPRAQRRVARCAPNGTFTFTTYLRGDGLPPGEYVVTLVKLSAGGRLNYGGADEFGNLYSNPRTSEFKIDHKSPGRKDLVFDLQIAGREPVGDPAPNP